MDTPVSFLLSFLRFRTQFEKDERGQTAKSLVNHCCFYCAVEYAKVTYTLDSSVSVQTSFFWRFVEHLGLPFESFTEQAVREFFAVSFPVTR